MNSISKVPKFSAALIVAFALFVHYDVAAQAKTESKSKPKMDKTEIQLQSAADSVRVKYQIPESRGSGCDPHEGPFGNVSWRVVGISTGIYECVSIKFYRDCLYAICPRASNFTVHDYCD